LTRVAYTDRIPQILRFPSFTVSSRSAGVSLTQRRRALKTLIERIVNECADGSADCSPYAECIDLQQGYMCKCKTGYTDVSSRYQLQPGRKCSQASNQCADPKTHSCDMNADCVQLPDGYTCKCFAGYVDVSSNANLAPGRVCTLSTVCPVQATDLVFLIDGSGSIGSYIFQTEVLRFLNEFTELFDIAPDKTRVSVVQYSDQIRHEFGLNEYMDSRSLHDAIKNIDYLTGLTRTGAAIEHVATEAFSEKRGARPLSQRVTRVGIVITDGRSQDNVTVAADNARRQNIQLFAVGVTNHVLQTELEEITGSKDRTFHVNAFEDLNTRLRSAIQRVTCPQTEAPKPSGGPCDPSSHAGCDRALNQVCMMKEGKYSCGCPEGFDQHPITKICEMTPFGNWRCTCPEDLGRRDQRTGACKIGEHPHLDTNQPETACDPGSAGCPSESHDECDPKKPNSCGPNAMCTRSPSGEAVCECSSGFVRNAKSDKCLPEGTCDPSIPNSCDARKKEKCLPNEKGEYTCQCDTSRFYKRHNVTEICCEFQRMIDECSAGTHDCDPNAKCTDTDESFICTCNSGFLDKSPDQTRKPGRKCTSLRNECEENSHNCSANADCIDLADGFLCRCKDGFVDVSPNMHAFAGLECRALIDDYCPSSTFSDTRDAYKCQCKEGYVDHDELRNPGRDCRKANQLCESGRHDCDKNAQCIERGTNDYECVCKAGFLDRSPLPHRMDKSIVGTVTSCILSVNFSVIKVIQCREPPSELQKTCSGYAFWDYIFSRRIRSALGRKCLERVCLDDTKHDCHVAAVCEEVDGPEKYTCKCRDGYVDSNKENPGRECRELVNECLDSSLNDCDPAATCRDTPDSYECECPIGSRDISKNSSKPGRNCFGLVNECLLPHLNNCSRFADCTDKEEGYECKFNECADPKLNDCDQNADCIDTDDGFVCQCKDGFFDENTDPMKTGRTASIICKKNYLTLLKELGLAIDHPQESEKTTLSPNLVPCGNTYCKVDLHEVCIGGSKCGCRPGESRSNPDEKCIPVKSVPIVVRVIDFDGEPLHYSTDYSKPTSPEHVQIVEDAVKGLGDVFRQTDIAPRYVVTDVNFITNPKVENSTWDRGLLINGSVKLSGDEDVDQCKLFKQFADRVTANGGRIAKLKVADDFKLLDPCKYVNILVLVEDQVYGTSCGTSFCNEALGEECIAGKLCGCPKGQKRKDAQSPCRVVESFNLPLYVIRDGSKTIKYTSSLANPRDEQHRDLVERYAQLPLKASEDVLYLVVSRFETGISQSYNNTPLRNGFVTVEVNDIEEPSLRNTSWVHGVLYNFTSHFVRGAVGEPSTVFTDLIEYISKKNNYEVGTSKLFISPDQANPFSACYGSDCHANAICTPLGKGYTWLIAVWGATFNEAQGPVGSWCQCPTGYRDLNPSRPGRQCLSYVGVNECEKPELNECSPDARCIDLDYLYKCECVSPYVNAAPEGAVPGSVCTIDYCSDVHYCPLNSTCKNIGDQVRCPLVWQLHEITLKFMEFQARCDCNAGFVDLRKSDRLSEAGVGDAICMRHSDVNECALGLHNCSAAAICIDTKLGYDCRCPDGCFGGRGVSQSSASGREILGSDYYTIPRAKLKPGAAYGDEMMGHDNAAVLGAYLDDGASISSDGSLEEVERRVTTDVTTREIRTTTVRDEMGNVVSQSQTDTEQYAMTSSDHFRQASAAGGAAVGEASALHGSSSMQTAASSGGHVRADGGEYDSDSDGSDAGRATYDRVTRVAQSHDFLPGEDPRTGTERRRNEVVTTTTAEEVNYF
uniref:VWFA domain-containing protein n=1 Tax=Heligmosomoides polygyrus TaxID=6339 RepID=A0A183FQQ6_HELPZ